LGLGFAAGVGFGAAGLVVVVVEVLAAGVVVLAGLAAPLAGVVVAGFAAPAAGTPEADAVSLGVPGVLAETGNAVSGVGSFGKGLDRMPAISSLRPASDLLRYLYQLVNCSIQSFLLACSAGSLPANATARA
jgi:hypothetical protein